MYNSGIGEALFFLLVIGVPLLIGWLKGDVVWDGKQLTMKKSPAVTGDRELELMKFNSIYIISPLGGNINER